MKLILKRKTGRLFGDVLIFFVFCMYPSAPSLAGSDQSGVESLDGLVHHLCRDTKHVLTSPFHWKQDDLIRFTNLSMATLELMLTDRDSQKLIQRNRTIDTDRVSDWTDKYTKRVANLTIGGFYLSGLVFHDRKSKETALLCLESVALAEGITISLKHLIGRSRPLGNQGAFDFNPVKFPPPSYSQSFPSGHATTAFAISSVIAGQYRNWLIRLASYSFAVAVAMGRVNNNAHFLSDVFFGGVIGIAVGRCLVRFHKREDSASACEFVSTGGSDNFGLGLLIWLK